MNLNRFLTWGFLPLLLLLLLSCEKFEGEQEIPSYLYIDTIFLQNNALIEEGELTHNFTDVWVYVDNQIIGAFEMPATIPVLVSGEHLLTLYPGIKLNGISGNRGIHTFIEPWVDESFEFVIDSVIPVRPGVSYYDHTDFMWLEDFEDASHAMVPTSNSDTSLNIFTRSPAIQFYGSHSGVGYLAGDVKVFEVVTFDEEIPGYEIDAGNVPVILEMDFNTNNYLVVGLFIREFGASLVQHPVVVLNPTGGKWKKVYVNFSPTISNFANSDYFNVYFRADKDPAIDTAVVKIDNLKLIQRGSF